ncbi:MAG: NAD(P)H-hydrate dehydratase [Gammaproteobacteria bacterium]
MLDLPEEVYSAQHVREFDRAAIEALDISAYELMCRAGEAALQCLESHWPQIRRLTIFCGAGNNAGDGYVLARLAARGGFDIRVIAVTPPDGLSGAAASAWEEFSAGGGEVEPLSAELSLADDVIVDGLLGTGLDRDLDGAFMTAVTAINTASNPVLALDIPTGLHADTGMPMGAAVHADVTITFVGLKSGLFLGRAPDYRGVVEFAGLGIPEEVYAQHPAALELLGSHTLRAALPPRRPSTHKGSHGNLLLVGGSPGMAGAIRLAAEAALRAGAGLVRVATHADCAASVIAGRPEIMCQALTEPAELDALIDVSDAVVVGPGLGRSDWARHLLERLLATELPMVLDADGLNMLAEQPRPRGNWILTPHPGEAARLLQSSVEAIQSDRLQAARDLVERYQGVVILKGAGSLVASPDELPVAVCDRGNPGMATAGMGDVLAGIVGALWVQKVHARLAAQAAVLLHALAGDAAVTDGQRGLMARDLMPHIRRWANPT